MWTSNIGLRPFCFAKWLIGFQALDLGFEFIKVIWVLNIGLGSWFQQGHESLKSWTWALIQKQGHVNFKSWVWTLTHSGKIKWALNLGLELQFKQSDVNLKPWAWGLIYARLDFSSRKVMWASSLELGLQFKQSDVGTKPWVWTFHPINVLLG